MVINKLKERLSSLDPGMKRASLVGSYGSMVMEGYYIPEEDMDIDILSLYGISREQFREEMDLRENSDISEMKEAVDRKIGPVEGHEVDTYLIFNDDMAEYYKMLQNNGQSVLIYERTEI